MSHIYKSYIFKNIFVRMFLNYIYIVHSKAEIVHSKVETYADLSVIINILTY